LSGPRSLRLELVVGTDADGDAHTLHKLDALSLSSTSVFRVSYLLAGKHFSTAEEIVFRSALVQYSHLESWSCFQFTHSEKSDSPDFFSIRVPASVVTMFDTGTVGPIEKLSLGASASSRFTLRGVEIRPSARFKVDLNADADLRTFLALLQELGQFVTMLVAEASYIKKLVVYGSPDTPVQVFFPSAIRAESDLHPLEMCFSLRDVQTVVQSLAEKWFDSLKLLAPVYDLLFGTLFARDSFVQTKFLSLTQALESIHRRTLGGTYMAPGEYLTVRGALISAFPAGIGDPLKQRLSDTIGYANEYSLRKRLKELLGGLDRSTVEMLKISDETGTIETIVKTRNYLTHFDEASKTSLASNIVSMHYMNERLTTLLFVLILKRLGLDEAKAVKGALKRRYFE
jgi:hypothetical protein